MIQCVIFFTSNSFNYPVTTPSKLAVTDTKKGIDMFTSMGVPTLAVVENMSFFEVRSSILLDVIILPCFNDSIQMICHRHF